MTIIPRIEFVAQVPLLKDILTERPERTVTRENAFDGVTQHFASVGVKAIDEIKTNVTLEDGTLKDRDLEPSLFFVGAVVGEGCVGPHLVARSSLFLINDRMRMIDVPPT